MVERLLNRNPMILPVRINVRAHEAVLLARFNERHSDAGNNHVKRIAGVAALLLLRSPSKVAAKVALVVVDTINRMLVAGARANVLKKAREVISPVRLHADAASTVTRKGWRAFVEAPGFDMRPNSIFGTPALSVRSHSVAAIVALQLETAAGFGVAASQLRAIHRNLFPALAAA